METRCSHPGLLRLFSKQSALPAHAPRRVSLARLDTKAERPYSCLTLFTILPCRQTMRRACHLSGKCGVHGLRASAPGQGLWLPGRLLPPRLAPSSTGSYRALASKAAQRTYRVRVSQIRSERKRREAQRLQNAGRSHREGDAGAARLQQPERGSSIPVLLFGHDWAGQRRHDNRLQHDERASRVVLLYGRQG